jgi:hypothetical protein
VTSVIGLFLPQYYQSAFIYFMPAFLGDLVLMLWLLIRGVNMEKWKKATGHT